jgi:3D (Asp-Asp-Asp) domain-containing protein
MEATAYCACYSCCGKYPSNKYYGVTKTGTRAKVGTIAVDPRKIPLGKSLYIEGVNGARNYGFGKAEDIGGAIKGNIIDLYFDTHEETIKWGRQQVKVYILK